jgi:hypothetical protein
MRLDDGEFGCTGYKRNAGKVDGIGTMLVLIQRCHLLTRIPSTTSELFYPVRTRYDYRARNGGSYVLFGDELERSRCGL